MKKIIILVTNKYSKTRRYKAFIKYIYLYFIYEVKQEIITIYVL